MKRSSFPVLLLAVAASAAIVPAAQAQSPDAARGKALYETHCGGCHYERLHERPRERSLVHSRDELRKQVELRAGLTKRPFTREDLDDIAAWLDASHYRFPK